MHYRHRPFLTAAIELSRLSVDRGGGPFGAVVVRQGEIIGRGHNQVTLLQDPTAHAEVLAIREACQTLQSFQLKNCDLYTSCEPCPMCLGAIYWARLRCVYYANSRKDAASIGFDDQFIYEELSKAGGDRRIPCYAVPDPEALAVFHRWQQLTHKTPY